MTYRTRKSKMQRLRWTIATAAIGLALAFWGKAFFKSGAASIVPHHSFLDELSAHESKHWIFGREARPTGKRPLLVVTLSRAEPSAFSVLLALTQLSLELNDQLDTLVIDLPTSRSSDEPPSELDSEPSLADGGWILNSPLVRDSHFKLWTHLGRRPWPSALLLEPVTDEILGSWSATDLLDTPTKDISTKMKSLIPQSKSEGTVNLDISHSLGGLSHFWSDMTHCRNHFVIADSAAHQILLLDDQGRIITTFGTGVPGFANGPRELAQFRYPGRVTCDADRGTIHVLDWGNRAIRLIDLNTSAVTSVERQSGTIPVELANASGKLLILDAGFGQQKIEILDLEQPSPGRNLPIERSDWAIDLQFHPLHKALTFIAKSSSHSLKSYNFGRETWSQHSLPAGSHGRWTTRRNVYDLESQTLWQASQAKSSDAKATNINRPESSTTESFESFSALSGLALGTDLLLAWDSRELKACAKPISRLKGVGHSNNLPAQLEIGRCFDFLAPLPDHETQPSLLGGNTTVFKAGVESFIDIRFDVPKGYTLSAVDLHKLTLPEGIVVAVPTGNQDLIRWKTPLKTGAQNIKFSPIVCEIENPGICKRLEIHWPIDIRESSGSSRLSLRTLDSINL